MSEEQSAKPASASRTGGECSNGDGAEGRLPISGSAGAMVMKSVSIFLARGRKASVSRQQSTPVDEQQELLKKRKRRRARTDLKMKSAAYYAKVIESLKKKTKFSK